jgi:hypothetical protein
MFNNVKLTLKIRYGRPWADIRDVQDLEKRILAGHRPIFNTTVTSEFDEDDGTTTTTAHTSASYSKLQLIVEKCWHQLPQNRPSFVDAHDEIQLHLSSCGLSATKVYQPQPIVTEHSTTLTSTAIIQNESEED